MYLPQNFPTVPFARCLESLPNLRTLEIGWMNGPYADPLGNALKGVELPQIKTLILPPAARILLRYCPNVEDVVCVVGGATTYGLGGLLMHLTANKDSKVKRLAIPLLLRHNHSSKRSSFLWGRHVVGTTTDRLQSQNMWPCFQGLLNSPSSTPIHSTPTEPQQRTLYPTQLGVHAPQCRT